jgi:putative tricarboxylic transport membrane protein
MKQDKITSLFWLLFGIFIVVESVKLGLGKIQEPGPGFVSFLGGVCLSLFSVVLMVKSFLVKPKVMDKEARNQIGKRWGFLFALIGVLIYVFIFEWLGFLISTFLLVTFLLKCFEQERWWKILLTAGVVSLSAFVIFDILLKAELPVGILRGLSVLSWK